MAKKDDMKGLGVTFYKEGIGGVLKRKKPEAKVAKPKAAVKKVPLPRPRPDFVNRSAKSDSLLPAAKKASGGKVSGKTKGKSH